MQADSACNNCLCIPLLSTSETPTSSSLSVLCSWVESSWPVNRSSSGSLINTGLSCWEIHSWYTRTTLRMAAASHMGSRNACKNIIHFYTRRQNQCTSSIYLEVSVTKEVTPKKGFCTHQVHQFEQGLWDLQNMGHYHPYSCLTILTHSSSSLWTPITLGQRSPWSEQSTSLITTSSKCARLLPLSMIFTFAEVLLFLMIELPVERSQW